MVPPGAIVPLHSHADPETFLPIAGELEALVDEDGRFAWVRVGPGDVFHVPGDAKHAFRNPAGEPAVMTIVSTARIGRFFREVGTAPDAGPPPPEHFAATSARYGYWNATLEENLAVGLDLSAGRVPGA